MKTSAYPNFQALTA